MLDTDRVYMLAADHRWQWEEWCDARRIDRARINEAKRVAFDGFMRARDRSADVRANGALLLDAQYSAAVIAEGLRSGVEVGTPAERAGGDTLAWATDPFSEALVGSFVKVLVRDRPDDDAAVREARWSKLDALQVWCRAHDRPLIIEILIARRGEDEDRFEADGRPRMLAAFIAEAYRRGLVPAFWKIEGTLSTAGAAIIDGAVAAHPRGRQILLGKAAELSTIDRWFAAAAHSTTAVGFAIGRSVFWSPSASFLSGELSASDAAERICATYLHLVDAWMRAKAGDRNV